MSEPRIYTERQMRQAKYEARKQAEEFLQERIRQFQAANNQLWEQMTNLDLHEPVEGVFVPYHLCESIVEKLKMLSGSTQNYYAKQLKHWMNKSDYEMLLRWERVGMLDEIEQDAV